MSTKKMAHWTDGFVANSDLPADEFTWTDASNYGLDGWHYEQTMNEGVMNHGDQSGLSGPITPAQMASAGDLPDDFLPGPTEDDIMDDTFTMSDDTFDLGAMLSEDEGALPLSKAAREAAMLADLAWLDPTQKQDPERLPKDLLPDRPPLNSIPELEEAWGVERRTDGLSLIPNRDKATIDYEKSLENPLPATPGNEGVPMHLALTRAVRRSTYGHSLRDIKAELVLNIGEDRAAAIMQRVAADHGLNGAVFIRASVFPGLKRGKKWAKHLRRVARTARYVITDDSSVATKLGLKMVSQVPWKKALRYYKPRLTAVGYKLASGDPKEVLRQAFLAGPAKAQVKAGYKPRVIPLADTVTAAEAAAAFKAAPKQARVVLASDETKKARRKVNSQIRQAQKAGLISKKDMLRFSQSTANPHDISRSVALQIRANQKPKKAVYGGVKMTAHHRQAAKASGIKIAEVRRLSTWLRRQMSEGVAGKDLTDLMRVRFASPLRTAASDIVSALRAEHEGLSGHLYVDAAAYASVKGTKGCEKAAPTHRASQVPTVMAMPRCKGCVFANADNVCIKYGKELLHKLPKGSRAHQREMVRLADTPDYEITASLFNPSEYDLAGSMEHIALDNEAPPSEELGDVIFGGLLL